jgi:hypothetical protein
MVRPVLYETVLFLLPFVLYGVWLAMRRTNPAALDAWRDAPILTLLIAALITTGIGLALVGHFGAAPAGSAYVPAHVENGKLVEPELK